MVSAAHIIGLVFGLMVFSATVHLYLELFHNPTMGGYSPKVKVSFRFNVERFVVFGVYLVQDQNKKTHATTIWRIGIGALCFNLEITIMWMNR